MSFVLLMNLQLQTLVNSVLLSIAEYETLSANEFLHLLVEKNPCLAELSTEKI